MKKTGFIHIFGAGTINQVVAFSSGIILVRIIPKTAFGVYSYTSNILQFFILFSGFGIVSAILQLGSENRLNPKLTTTIFNYGFKLGMKINIIISISILLFSLFVPLNLEGSNTLLLYMSFLPLFFLVLELILIYYRFNMYNRVYSWVSVINTVNVLVFSIIGALFFFEKGLVLFRYIAYFITIFIAVFLFKFPIPKIRSRVNIDKNVKKDVWKISFISMANNATSHLIYIVDIFILGLLVPVEGVIASYKVATLIPGALVFIPSTLMIFFYPYFAEKRKDKVWVKKSSWKLIGYFSIFNLALSTFLIMLAPWILNIIFGEQYLDALLPFRLLIASYFVSASFRTISGTLLVTQRKLKFNFFVGIFEGLLNTVMNILLIPALGSIGAALASLFVVTITSVLSLSYFIRSLRIKTVSTKQIE